MSNYRFGEFFFKYLKPKFGKSHEQFVKYLQENIFKTKAEIELFDLPYDLKDGFFYSAWKYPEKYLLKEFRNGISVFSSLPNEEMLRMLDRLNSDLNSGKWNSKYQYVKKMKTYNGGYYFLRIKK